MGVRSQIRRQADSLRRIADTDFLQWKKRQTKCFSILQTNVFILYILYIHTNRGKHMHREVVKVCDADG